MKKLDPTFGLVLEAVLTSGKTSNEMVDMLKLLDTMRSAYIDNKIDNDLAWQKGWLDCMDKMRELMSR